MTSFQSRTNSLRTTNTSIANTSKTASSFKIFDENVVPTSKSAIPKPTKRTALGELRIDQVAKPREKNTTKLNTMGASLLQHIPATQFMINKPQPKEKKEVFSNEIEGDFDDSEVEAEEEGDELSDEEYMSEEKEEQPVDKVGAREKAILDPMEIENLRSEDDQDYWDEEVEDIDADDWEDPQFCSEYVNIIFDYFRNKEVVERVTPTYMSQQVDLTPRHRLVLVDWLAEVSQQFHLLTETLFLTVRLVDRFLMSKSVVRQKLQLVGISAMLVASKYEEMYHPQLRDFIWISAGTYTEEELRKMEQLILITLDFNLNAPSPLHFLRRFSRAARSDSRIHTLSKYLSELSLIDYNMLNYLPSMIAAAAVYIARMMTETTPAWNKTLEHYTTYSEADILQCARDLNGIAKSQATSKYRSLHKKYSTKQLLSVSTIPCIDF